MGSNFTGGTKRYRVEVAFPSVVSFAQVEGRVFTVKRTLDIRAQNVDHAAQAAALEVGAVGWDYVEFSWAVWATDHNCDPTWFMPDVDHVFFISEAP